MINLLTFDVEEWFRANTAAVDASAEFGPDLRLEANVRKLLAICERRAARATRLRLPARERFIHYVDMRTAEKKLERLLASHEFCTIREYLCL